MTKNCTECQVDLMAQLSSPLPWQTNTNFPWVFCSLQPGNRWHPRMPAEPGLLLLRAVLCSSGWNRHLPWWEAKMLQMVRGVPPGKCCCTKSNENYWAFPPFGIRAPSPAPYNLQKLPANCWGLCVVKRKAEPCGVEIFQRKREAGLQEWQDKGQWLQSE